VDSASWNFWFVGHGVEFDLATNEGISIGQHMVQFGNYEINCVGSSGFHN
jgi:hypothetical protein